MPSPGTLIAYASSGTCPYGYGLVCDPYSYDPSGRYTIVKENYNPDSPDSGSRIHFGAGDMWNVRVISEDIARYFYKIHESKEDDAFYQAIEAYLNS